MHTVKHDSAVSYSVAADHPNRKAHQWLSGLLESVDWNAQPPPSWNDQHVREPILARLNEQAKGFQIALLKACLERMAWHRQQRSGEAWLSPHYHVGALLYAIACTLYQRKLPYGERDIYDILSLSQHTCGHGCDVTPPFDIALAYARKNGLTSELLAALRTFMNGLKGVGSAQVTFLKRKAGLLLILDAESGGKSKCWSDRFGAGLLALPPEEQAKWRRLVAHMNANDVQVVRKAWGREATKFIDDLGAALVVERLSAWWPDPRASAVWPIQTGGSHLLKYFIWLLGMVAAQEELTPKCTELVSRLSELDWKPRERGQKVMIAAACYLAQFPPALSWPALQRLAAWSASAPDGGTDGKIPELLRTFCAQHRLAMPQPVR